MTEAASARRLGTFLDGFFSSEQPMFVPGMRRLLATADKKAAELGSPDTEAGLTADMLDV